MKKDEKNFNFTMKAIDALPLPSPGKRLYVYDTKVRGLELMVTEQGSQSFKVYRKFNNKPLRITLGRYPEMTIEMARKEAQNRLAELNTGKNPNEEKKKLRKETTLGDFFPLFMERYSKQHKKTWVSDNRDIPRFLGHWFRRKLSAINRQEVQALHEKIRLENRVSAKVENLAKT